MIRAFTLALAIGSALAVPAAAQSFVFRADPQFTSTYEIEGVSASGVSATMTFKIRIFSMTDRVVDTDRVVLTDPANTDNAWAEFRGVRFSALGDVDLREHITVPIAEYERWTNGGPPVVFVWVRNDFGDNVRI